MTDSKLNFSPPERTAWLIKLLWHVFGVAECRLGEIAKVRNGEAVTKGDCDPGGKYPVFGGSLNPLGRLDRFNACPGSVILVAKGNAGDVGFVRERFFATSNCYILECSGFIVPEYLYYVLESGRERLKRLCVGVIPNLNRGALENFPVRFPTIQAQRSIVAKLDKFRRLHTKTFSGLGTRWESMSAACFDTN